MTESDSDYRTPMPPVELEDTRQRAQRRSALSWLRVIREHLHEEHQ